MTADPLRLIAFDRDDIEVVSTHLQDAVVKIGDIHWLAAQHRVVVACNRFDWEEVACGCGAEYHRRRTALRFDRVLSFKARGVSPADKDAVLNLLAVEFSETASPGGTVTLTFSGGAVARIEVECLECEMADLGPAWATACCPDHSQTTRPAQG